MCVIITGAASKIVPLVADAMQANPHGAGISWVQSDGRLAYRKGITSAKRARKILSAIGAGDAVFHARIATSGGNHALLSHPFRVERFSPVSYAGRNEDFLLFHNGISSLDWQSHVPVKSGLYWSDTRTLAHAIATGAATVADLKRDGGKWLLFFTEKNADGTRSAYVQRVGYWQTHNLHPGLHFSNLNFLWTRDMMRSARNDAVYGTASARQSHWWDDPEDMKLWSGML